MLLLLQLQQLVSLLLFPLSLRFCFSLTFIVSSKPLGLFAASAAAAAAAAGAAAVAAGGCVRLPWRLLICVCYVCFNDVYYFCFIFLFYSLLPCCLFYLHLLFMCLRFVLFILLYFSPLSC